VPWVATTPQLNGSTLGRPYARLLKARAFSSISLTITALAEHKRGGNSDE